ncbi:MAG: hypothetical protein JW982_01345 [Spirochaetes bacterium]|nr:hypothetical protein [Spirochaetota bacterium]
MHVFDGFIAAVASEFRLKFNKTEEGAYTTKLEFENNRSQEVLITLTKDEAEDRIIRYYSIVAKLKADFGELYKFALQTNTTLDYGALALLNDTLILVNSIPLESCEPVQFIKSLTYIAAKADELEEMLVKKNLY